MDAPSSSRLVVFVKAPRPGAVKTRLANTIGEDTACGVYRELVAAVLDRIAAIPFVELRFSPDDALDEIKPWARRGWRLAAQGEGDLGARLCRAFDCHFASGAERVVVIGSDCPEMAGRDVRDAWDALADHDVVLGPAADGGYWLVGLRSSRPGLFSGISWSSATVLEKTLTRARREGLAIHLLRTLRDVDTADDLQYWRDRQFPGAVQ